MTTRHRTSVPFTAALLVGLLAACVRPVVCAGASASAAAAAAAAFAPESLGPLGPRLSEHVGPMLSAADLHPYGPPSSRLGADDPAVPAARNAADPASAGDERALLHAQLSELRANHSAAVAAHQLAWGQLNASYVAADALVERSALACVAVATHAARTRSCRVHRDMVARVTRIQTTCPRARRPARCLDRYLPRAEALADATAWDCARVAEEEQSEKKRIGAAVAAEVGMEHNEERDMETECKLRQERRRRRSRLRKLVNPNVVAVRDLRRRINRLARQIVRVVQKIVELGPEPTDEPVPDPSPEVGM